MNLRSLWAYLLCTWISICITNGLRAQDFPMGLPEITNYTSKDYRWHPKNFKIVQGQNGLIYVGNAYGILEFDGKSWRQISLPNSLECHALLSLSDGKVIAGSFNEVGEVRIKENGQSGYQSLSTSDQLTLGAIQALHEYNGQIIVVFNSSILLLTNNKFQELVVLDQPIIFSSIANEELIYQVNDELHFFSISDRKISKKKPIGNHKVVSYDGNNTVLTEAGDVIALNLGKTVKKELFQQLRIRKLLQLTTGQFAIATHNKGLLITDSLFNTIQQIDISNGLLSNQIFDVMQDMEGNLWLTLDNGISHIAVNTPFTQYSLAGGVHGMGYASVSYQNKLFLGTTQGVYQETRQNRFIKVVGSSDQVYGLQTHDDLLWLSSETGLYVYQNNGFKRISPELKAWCAVPVPRRYDLLIVGTEQGIYLLKKQKDNWDWQGQLQGFEESSRIMVFDQAGNLWMVHGNKGVYKLKLDLNSQSINLLDFYSTNDGTLPVYVSNATKSKKGVLFSTENGVFTFNRETQTFDSIPEINQFLGSNRYVDNIREDPFGNIWLLQEDIISKLDLLDNGAYTLLDENKIRELNGRLVGSYEHLQVFDANNVIIGTQDGFAHYNINANINYRKNLEQNEFQTVIRSVRISGRDTTFLADLTAKNAIILPHFLNNITITYAPGFYQSYGPAQFSFYLEDLNNSSVARWEDWHSSNQNVFENLAPGRYVFHVRSSGDQVKNTSERAFKFTILEPWFASRLSFGIYTLVALALGFVIYKYRVRKIKTEKRVAIEQKEEELEQQKLLAETEKVKLINERLKEKVTLKNKELGSVALEITQKNEFLSQLKKSLATVVQESANKDGAKIKKAIRSIDQNMRSDNNWERFEYYFDETHQDFIKKLKEKHPNLTKSSISLCAFLHLDLSTKEIAALMNISPSGVEKRRYRLRKTLGLETEVNLNNYLNSF